MMWQEARKQERKIRGLLVDYKKRAERRKEYYEKIKADPTQFIQLHGRPCKIHLDPAIAIAADSPANMMPWQGNQDILIDRFDVRAHLDFIPELKPSLEDEELEYDDRHINYERYRILVQNDFLGVTEDKFLHQLTVEEQFGPVERLEPPPIEGKKKVPGAAISYNYNESTVIPSPAGDPVTAVTSDQEDEEDEEDSDIDFDLCVDINKIGSQQAHEMNACALIYGMTSNDFFSFLTRDVEEAENLKIAREREEEKAMYSGRKSRRERRAYREKKLIGRKISPPSYASKTGPLMMKSPSKSASKSRSRTVSPINAGQITYITSFGGEEVQEAPPQLPKISVPQKEEFVYKRTVRYRSRSRSQSPKRRISYRAKSRSRSRGRTKSISQTRRSRSRSKDRRSRSQGHRSRSPISTSRSRSRRSRSRGNSRRSPHRQPHYRKHYNSRSRSRSKSPYKMNTSNSKKSKSPSPTVRSIQVPDPPIITRYYGRHKTNSSSSELELSDSDKESSEKNMSTSENSPCRLMNNRTGLGNSIGRNKQLAAAPVVKMTPQERLKRKMQILLNRQYKADKRAERVRLEKAEQERQDREDEMREISIKMRRRERQKRHQYYEYSESADGEHEVFSSISSQSLSTTPSPDPEFRHGGNSDRRNSKDREKLKEKRSKHEREERDKERRGRRERDSKDRDGRDNRIRGESRDRRDHRLRENSCDRSENRTRGSSRDNGGSRSKKEVWDRKDNRSRGESRDQANNRTRNDSRDREDIRSRCDSRDRDIRSRGGTRDNRSRKNSRDSEHQSRSSRDRESRSKGVSSRGESSKITRPLVDY